MYVAPDSMLIPALSNSTGSRGRWSKKEGGKERDWDMSLSFKSLMYDIVQLSLQVCYVNEVT